MIIQLVDTRVSKLAIEKVSSESVEKDCLGEMRQFSVKSGFNNNDKHNYVIIFEIQLLTECLMSVTLEYEAQFKTESEIDDEFISSQFVKVNSPAIAYPYLRAYVSTVLTLSGFSSIILPTMNFQAMFKKSQHTDK